MGMYSYYLGCEPADAVVDIAQLDGATRDYFAFEGGLSSISLDELGREQDDTKLFGHMEQDWRAVISWRRALLATMTSSGTARTPVRLFFEHADNQVSFYERTTLGALQCLAVDGHSEVRMLLEEFLPPPASPSR